MDGDTDKINMTTSSTANLSPPCYGSGEKGVAKSECKNQCKSTFEQLQDAKMESTNDAKYASDSIKIILASRRITYLMPALIGLPIAMIVNGAYYINECPVERFIPIYMIVAGAVFLCQLIINYTIRMAKLWQKRGPLAEDTTGEKFFHGITSVMGAFLFGFFIAANVWVFRVYAPSEDPAASTYCNPKVYRFAFGTIIAAYGVAVLTTCLSCCCSCWAASRAIKKASGQGQNSS